MLADRGRRRQSEPEDILRSHVEHSLTQVQHQIWLLRNVFWWYLLPPFTAMIFWFIRPARRLRNAGLEVLGAFAAIALFVVLVAWFIYWLNQFAVRKTLEPRRRELQALLGSLDEAGESRRPRRMFRQGEAAAFPNLKPKLFFAELVRILAAFNSQGVNEKGTLIETTRRTAQRVERPF